MAKVTLDEAKFHLRIDGDEEDTMLAAYIAATEEYLASIGVDMTGEPLPAPLKAAMLLHVAGLFEARGGPISIPHDRTWERLIAPYRTVSL
jgi:uncharacterized phage protein (predicted DNA packaging)